MKGNNKKFVAPRFAKDERYKKVLNEIASAGVCPFCPENFRWHTKPILKRSGGWFITENFSSYKNALHHLIIVNKKHKEHFTELSAKDWRDLSHLASWAIRKFKIKGGGLALRFGDTDFTGATVRHLHAHLIVPRLKKNVPQTVVFPIG